MAVVMYVSNTDSRSLASSFWKTKNKTKNQVSGEGEGKRQDKPAKNSIFVSCNLKDFRLENESQLAEGNKRN